MNILAVIPARGGSKGIPRKNLRILAGKPLICYALENAKKSVYITDIVVSSDNAEILELAQKYDIFPLQRRPELAQDTVTLDPVIYDAVIAMEAKRNITYDIVITMQPTSPLLHFSTLDNGISAFLEDDKDSYISVVNRPHLSWRKSEGRFVPNYARRLNRQQLDPMYFETGAFFISRRNKISENDRLGKNVSIYEIPENEAVDIDTPEDWLLCEHILLQKTVCFYINGKNKEETISFAVACRNLAYHLTTCKIFFACSSPFPEVQTLLKNSFFKFKIVTPSELHTVLSDVEPDIMLYLNDFNRSILTNKTKAVRGVICKNPAGDEIYLGDGMTLPEDCNRIFGLDRIKKLLENE